jgi:hypothetical protein
MLRILSGKPSPAKLGSRIAESSWLNRKERTTSWIGTSAGPDSDWIGFLEYRFGHPST